uniref:Uncharacterized protein n=1 Tax=viral metagenome TaxID=1070528 RepID=A0A6C0EEV6_9ZZZZ
MNTFKKFTNATATQNTKKTILSSSININSIHDFPSLNNIRKMENDNNFNFIDATKKKIEENKPVDNSGLCTIYYDKILKKTIRHNFPKKMYDDDDSSDSDSSDDDNTSKNYIQQTASVVPSIYNVQYPELHNGMNKAIKNIMERRDIFIDQYGADEFIRDYLSKDSQYLYSRYYYKNKYMSYHKNKVNIINNNHVNTFENNDVIYDRNENYLTQYDDIEVDIDSELLHVDDDNDDIEDEDDV